MVDDNNHIMEYYCLLLPNSTGTVISLDKFMRDNRDILKFQQVGTVYGSGHMQFFNSEDQEMHTVTTEERNGLWYASNSILMPPTSAGPTKRNIGACSSFRLKKMATQNDQAKDSDVGAKQFYAMHKNTAPTISIRTAGFFTNMSKALKQLELLHQRIGHLAPRTVRHTQKCVDGMPPLPDASPIFSCMFCDMAKQRKSNHGLPISSENY